MCPFIILRSVCSEERGASHLGLGSIHRQYPSPTPIRKPGKGKFQASPVRHCSVSLGQIKEVTEVKDRTQARVLGSQERLLTRARHLV